MNRKQKTGLIVAAIVLALAIAGYFIVLAITMKEEEKPSYIVNTDYQLQEGEAMYMGRLVMYEVFDTTDIDSLVINTKNGSVEFESRISETTGNRVLRLKEYPAVRCNDAIMNNIYTAVTATYVGYDSNQNFFAYHDVTEKEKIEYGVTPETCTMSYTVTYTIEGKDTVTHTVYVGEQAHLSTTSYYAAVEGRDSSVYIIDSTVNSFMDGGSEEFYINPLIYSGTNATDTMYRYENFSINRFKVVRGEDGNLTLEAINQLLGIHADREIVVGESISIYYKIMNPTKASGLNADQNYIYAAYQTLFTSFSGDSVVALAPDEETLDKYGFGFNDEIYIILAQEFKNDPENEDEIANSVMYRISDLIDGYYYCHLGGSGEEGTSSFVPESIVRIPAAMLSFVEEENIIRWVATNSIESGFCESISAKEDSIGVKKMHLVLNTSRYQFDDTFNLEYTVVNDDDGKKLRVWLDKNKNIEFVDKEEYESVSERNQFNNFYAVLLNYPMPYVFNDMTDEEKEEIKTNKDRGEIVMSLYVELNDGTLLTYDYYRIDGGSHVMCEFTDQTFKEPTIIYNTTMEQVFIVADALDDLMAGKQVIVK
ncbi:MAG: DUF4340 domain-containing protein [Clostridia bacterium]|nr:DUF4340 domain-containing protein [Clostridia bacterium]